MTGVAHIAEYVGHDWIAVTVTLNGRKRHGFHCHRCYKRAVCPHGCGFLRWVEDEWYCPKCGDEWHDEETFDSCEASPNEQIRDTP